MSLEDAFSEEFNRKRYCGVETRTKDLSTEDKEILQKYLKDPSVSNLAIVRALKRVGVNVSNDVVRYHRNESCCCYRNVV